VLLLVDGGGLGVVPGAHVDLCDLTLVVGQLASFGLLMAKGRAPS
jgi:hypothetical protein